MWGVDFPSDEPLAYTVIGVQYPTGGSEKEEATTTAVPPPPPAAQARLINTLDTLLTPSSPSSAAPAPAPAHTDRLLEDGRAHLAGWTTRLWLSYWPTARAYDDWARCPAVAAFWAALAPDAGVYREVVRIAPPRAQLGTNHDDRPAGLGHVGALKPQFDKALYWGCYRDRYRASSSSCPGRRSGEEEDNNNMMDSPLGVLPTPRRSSREGGTTVRRRPGRTTITRLPDNLCFVVEGQDHAALSPREKQHWFAHFDGPVTRWMQDLMAAGLAEGLLDAKICYADDSGRYHDTKDDNNDQTPPALTYNKKVQLFWFLDHRHMEKIGRANKGHVALRNNFIQSYGPGGAMADEGNLLLWVETSVLKADEIEAEYIGVVEGTGFLAYDHHPEFQSSPTA